MSVKEVVDAYAEELQNWDFFSDSQRAYVDENSRIVVCLRDYKWYITKDKITNALDAIKALFEIDWCAEYDGFDKYMKYWIKY